MAGTVTAVAAITGALVGGVSAEQNARAQRRSRRDQRTAQNQATAQAASQQRREQQQFAAVNRQQPDFSAMLAAEQEDILDGIASTLLTGHGGIDPSRLRFGRPASMRLGGKSLLGE